MNTTIILILVFVCISVYLIVQHKSNFEKRLAYHTPRLLTPERQEYINGAERYIKKVSIIIGLFAGFPLMIMCAFLLPEAGASVIFLIIVIFIAINFLGIYLLYRFFKRNIKNQQALLEQMSDSDFQLLLRVNKEIYLFKYFPPFVLCKDKLYLFTSLTVEEIDPTKIEKVTFAYVKGGNIVVRMKLTKTISITMYRTLYPILVEIIKRYNPNIEMKSLK
ncbi:hypothetical protein I7X30_08975 [Capnocytophaga sp. 051621]|jgi:hypothetical protein|uniref:Uncharacterized protein n=2 Tax=Capnocytophaga TaxID=1016 RepID=A0ABS1YYP8_9FLAO|nr:MULTISPECIES: hypothetical protein [Capnocytophaga]MBI1647187.1 hypothetical protein [Capnocytophaga periodontitidis]MBM0651549.1 hypothetical protein [Capnocytophaga genosp. AHN8471]MBM0662113.1 hypothetical protein [Capnocytophaga genosp. AHN8471]